MFHDEDLKYRISLFEALDIGSGGHFGREKTKNIVAEVIGRSNCILKNLRSLPGGVNNVTILNNREV